jgi:curved DNA-binding protein CbpA
VEQYEINWKNYYEILQLSPNAEPAVVAAAYRRLSQMYHPDMVKDPTVSSRMTDINEAYEVLSDSARRAKYDYIFNIKYENIMDLLRADTMELSGREEEEEEETYEEALERIRRKKREQAKTKYNFQETNTAGPSEEDILVSLMKFAAEKAAEGKTMSQVADELTRKGIPYDIAAEVVKRVFEYRSEFEKKEGGKGIGCGLLMLIVGGIITGAGYEAATGGGTYIITVGLFIVGAITLVRGLYKWFTS